MATVFASSRTRAPTRGNPLVRWQQRSSARGAVVVCRGPGEVLVVEAVRGRQGRVVPAAGALGIAGPHLEDAEGPCQGVEDEQLPARGAPIHNNERWVEGEEKKRDRRLQVLRHRERGIGELAA